MPWVPSASIVDVRAAAGQSLDLRDDIDLAVVEDDIRAHPPGHLEPDRIGVDPDDQRRA